MKQKEKKTRKVKTKLDGIEERLLNQLEDAKREGNGLAVRAIEKILNRVKRGF